MPAQKRKNAAAAPVKSQPAPKRAKKVTPEEQRVKTVESVLASSEVGVVFGMLRDACHLAFAQDSVQRSKYESEVIDMITHAMQDMHAGAVSVKTEKGQVKVSAEAASQAAQDKQADLVKKLEHQKDAVKAAQLLQVTREGLLKKAQKSKTVFDKDNKAFQDGVERMNQEVEEAKKNKANVDHLRDNVDGMNEKDRRKFMCFLNPLMKKMKCDDSLVKAAPVAYMRNTNDRLLFDKTAIDQVDSFYQQYLIELNKKVDAFGPQMADFQAKEELVATELAKAEQELESAKEDLSKSATQKELEDSLKEAKKDVRSTSDDLSVATSDFDDASERVTEVEQAMKCGRELTDRVGDSLSAGVGSASGEEGQEEA